MSISYGSTSARASDGNEPQGTVRGGPEVNLRSRGPHHGSALKLVAGSDSGRASRVSTKGRREDKRNSALTSALICSSSVSLLRDSTVEPHATGGRHHRYQEATDGAGDTPGGVALNAHARGITLTTSGGDVGVGDEGDGGLHGGGRARRGANVGLRRRLSASGVVGLVGVLGVTGLALLAATRGTSSASEQLPGRSSTALGWKDRTGATEMRP